ncbi:MAG: menaquinone biosynthesis protein [Vicinamibacteria bacterium]
MTDRLRVGLFPYLNVQPLVFGLRDEPGMELVLDLPSRIADLFRSGELDLAMVPSFEAATLQARVLPSVCIASDGPVETVLLHHRVGLSEVRTLAADEASRTSVALSKILIAEASGRVPSTVPYSPSSGATPDADAMLVIGDPAFAFSRDGYARMDLGEAWRAKRALPFVFAVLVAGGRAAGRGLAARIREATLRGLDAASDIARSYNSGVDAARAEHYLRHVIRYDLGAREKEGLALFHRLAQEKGLLAQARELEFDAI